MIVRHYNKPREWRQHLREKFTRATLNEGGNGETAHRPPEGAE
jgi:hypothetical protein